MNAIRKLFGYFGTVNMSGTERRIEANEAYAQQLIESERTYWRGYLSKATSDVDREKALHEIRHLNALEAANG